MSTIAGTLFSIAAAIFAGSMTPAFAQGLSMSYNLESNAQGHRSSIANAGCAGYGWVAGVSSCEQRDPLGRYSGQVQGESVARFATAPAQNAGPAVSRESADGIPYLGENDRKPEARNQYDPEFNLQVGERPRVRKDIERRFHDAALQEARFNRNLINALGLEVLLPIQGSTVRQSADPAVPE